MKAPLSETGSMLTAPRITVDQPWAPCTDGITQPQPCSPRTGNILLCSSGAYRGHCGKAEKDSQIICLSTHWCVGWAVWVRFLLVLLEPLGIILLAEEMASWLGDNVEVRACCKAAVKQTQNMKRKRFYPSPARQPASLLHRISVNVMRVVRARSLAYTKAAILLLLAG